VRSQADRAPDASEADLAFEDPELSRGVARDVGRLGFGRLMRQGSADVVSEPVPLLAFVVLQRRAVGAL